MEPKIADTIFTLLGTQLGLVVLLLLTVIAAWWKLSSDLTKLRIQATYQVNRDLLSKRFQTYGALWTRMQPTALYTATKFGPSEAAEFSESLSKWYFSDNGGLFLSTRVRDFYFSLQDLVRTVGRLPNWSCDERLAAPQEVFGALLRNLPPKDQYEGIDLNHPETLDPRRWRRLCQSLSAPLESLIKGSDPKAGEVVFAAVQQVSSVLRSNLTHELRSRLDVEWPT
jgi:hypothetical protein